ncbi:MAG: sensor histidine kinase N-terminal domain-containing protein [Paracoccaceae bacterium]
MSLRQRLVLQLLALAAVLAVLLYLTVRTVAGQAAETSLDGVLGAAATSVAEQLRSTDDGIEVDLPYSAFSVLGSVSEERVFYRIDAGGATVTGYDDLPRPQVEPSGVEPVFYSVGYRDVQVRVAAVRRVVLTNEAPVAALVMVAQTRLGQADIAARIANSAAARVRVFSRWR